MRGLPTPDFLDDLWRAPTSCRCGKENAGLVGSDTRSGAGPMIGLGQPLPGSSGAGPSRALGEADGRPAERIEPLEGGSLQRAVIQVESVDIDPRSHVRPRKKEGPLRRAAPEPTTRCRRVADKSLRPMSPARKRMLRCEPRHGYRSIRLPELGVAATLLHDYRRLYRLTNSVHAPPSAQTV